MRSESQASSPADTGDRSVPADKPLFADADELLRQAQDVIGRKWHPILVYHLLAGGPLGFSSLKSRVDGISSKMLSESLHDLQDRGLVTRTLLSDQPVRVEYSLTEQGRALEPLLGEMLRWGTARQTEEGEG